jgi:hypothetical protein
MRDATAKWGMTCPINMVGSPGIILLHTCIDYTFLPSGMLMVIGLVAMHLLLTSTPSIIKIDVVPVSAMACRVAIVIPFIVSSVGAPNNTHAVAAVDGH